MLAKEVLPIREGRMATEPLLDTMPTAIRSHVTQGKGP
ncbi:hypothetical protein [Azospirillum doebereinerae]